MKVYLFLSFIAHALSFDLPATLCAHDVRIDDAHYNLTTSHALGNATPTEAQYDVYGNLFYVHLTHEPQEYRYDAFVLKNDSDVPVKIEGLPEGKTYSVAIDKTYGAVYFGTSNGIYYLDYENYNATLESSSDLELDNLFLDKDGNKYITANSNGLDELYLLEGDKKVRYNAVDTLNELAIDDNNNFYFIRQEKLFKLQSDLLNPDYICDVTYDGIAQITFHDNKVFVASQQLIYFHQNGGNKFKTVHNIPGNVTTVAFKHNGDFTVGTAGKLLKYEKDDCYFRQ